MKQWRALPLRTKILFLVLFLLGIVYVYSLAETRFSARGLEQVAQKEIDGIHTDTNDVAWEVTVSKRYILFGSAQGKVEIFVRPKSPQSDGRIHSVSLYYNRQAGEWVFDGSGASVDEESHQKGLRVFARRNPAALH